MSGAHGHARLASVLALVLALAAIGCDRAPRTAPPVEGSAAAATEATATPEAPPADEPALAAPEEKPDEPVEAAPTMHIPLLELEGEPDAAGRVAHGVYRARMIALNHALHRFEQAPSTAADGVVDASSLRLIFASNVGGELTDCGCLRNPLGGLARRARLVADWSDEGLPVIHIDTGNALVRDARVPSEQSRAAYELGAETMLQAFGAMQLSALAVGVNDAAIGGARLRTLAAEHRVPLLSANWFVDGAPLGQSRLVVEREGVSYGFTAVGPTTGPTSDFFVSSGVDARSDRLAGAEVAALRAEGAGFVTLIVTGGLEQATRLVESLDAEALPDLVLLSGSRRTMREPIWVRGIPFAEASDRGRNLVALDLGLDGPSSGFARNAGDASERIRQVRTAVQVAETTENRLREAQRSGAPEQRVRTFETLLRRQYRQLAQQMRALNATDTGDPTARWTLLLHLNGVPLTVPEDPAIAEIVAAAAAAGWTPPHPE
jgi:2',3'-cyclic-nucleotide 2'-phosphodiesterase (5'-nucleotidase family)